MPPTAGQLSPHRADIIESFEPLRLQVQATATATAAAAANTASQRLQRIHITNALSDAFGYVVAKQWRVDTATNRETWAVVKSGLECEVLLHGLASRDASDVPGLAIDKERIDMIEEATDCEKASQGQLRIMSFSTLRTFLYRRYWEAWLWKSNFGSPTIIMNFGWGNTDSDMAFACLGVTKLIEENTGKAIMAGVVSSGNWNPFGNGQKWQSVRTQNITGCSSDLKLKGTKLPKATIGRDARLALVADRLYELNKRVLNSGDERKRMLLVMDKPELETICEALDTYEPSREIDFKTASGPSDLGPLQNENVALVEGVTYIGRAYNVSDIVVYPYTSAFITEYDQTVFGEGTTTRSRSEVLYRSRYWHAPGTHPRIQFLGTKEEYEKLPTDDETSLAHTEHLPRVLLCGILLWGRVPVAEMPMSLPRRKAAVEEQLRRLVLKGLIEVKSVAKSPDGSLALGKLYGEVALTDLGRRTANMLAMGAVESLHSACLLGRLMVKEARNHVGLTRESAVVDAIYAIAAVTETINGRTMLQKTIALFDKGRTGPREWYTRSLFGVGADHVCRGPIWLAVAMWQRLREDWNWRGDWGSFKETISHQENIMTCNEASIMVSRHSSLVWDAALAWFNSAPVVGIKPPKFRGNSRLTRQALLAVERAMVLAFLDKLACAKPGDEFLAWDLVSRRKLAQPADYQWGQVWLEDCLQSDAIEGQNPPLAFFIYTGLIREEGNNGVVWRPLDLTYVSIEAVYGVLTEVGDDGLFAVPSSLGYSR